MFGLTLFLAIFPTTNDDPPPARALPLYRGIVVDDLEREGQRLQDGVLVRRSQIAATQRLFQQGVVSREQVEREKADLKDVVAREEEALAFLAIKSYERDVLDRGVALDERKASGLLLDWVRRQLNVALVNADFQAYKVKQVSNLFRRKAATKEELEDAESAKDTALEAVAASLAREAQAVAALARAEDDGGAPAKTKTRSLQAEATAACLRQFEVRADVARRRLAIARDRSRRGLLPASEVILFERAVADADAALALGRKVAEGPDPLPSSRVPDAPGRR